MSQASAPDISHASLLTDFVDHKDKKTHIQTDVYGRIDKWMNRQTDTCTDCLTEEETFSKEMHTSWTCSRWSATAASASTCCATGCASTKLARCFWMKEVSSSAAMKAGCVVSCFRNSWLVGSPQTCSTGFV